MRVCCVVHPDLQAIPAETVWMARMEITVRRVRLVMWANQDR